MTSLNNLNNWIISSSTTTGVGHSNNMGYNMGYNMVYNTVSVQWFRCKTLTFNTFSGWGVPQPPFDGRWHMTGNFTGLVIPYGVEMESCVLPCGCDPNNSYMGVSPWISPALPKEEGDPKNVKVTIPLHTRAKAFLQEKGKCDFTPDSPGQVQDFLTKIKNAQRVAV